MLGGIYGFLEDLHSYHTTEARCTIAGKHISDMDWSLDPALVVCKVMECIHVVYTLNRHSHQVQELSIVCPLPVGLDKKLRV